MLFGALAVLAPALAGCEAGYNAPTLEYHPAAFGAYATKNGVSISNAFVLGPSPSGPEVAGGRAGVFLAITSQDGELVKLNLTFAEAGTIAMTVPVQPKAYEYATFSPPPTPPPAATKKKANPSASASASESASPGATASPTATPT